MRWWLGAVLAGAAMASAPASAQVKSGDTFQWSLVGWNVDQTAGYYLITPKTAVFGQTSNVTDRFGQSMLFSSGETLSGSTYTDSFRLTAPTNLIPANMVDNTTISRIEFSIGLRSGVQGTAANMVDLAADPLSISSTASWTYPGGTLSGPSSTTSANRRYSVVDSLYTSNGSALSPYGFKQVAIYTSYGTAALAPAAPGSEAGLGLLSTLVAAAAMLFTRVRKSSTGLTLAR